MKMNSAITNNKVRDIGCPRFIVKVTKIWTNNSRVKEEVDEELRKTKSVIHSEGVKAADDSRESENICMIEEAKGRQGTVYVHRRWRQEGFAFVRELGAIL